MPKPLSPNFLDEFNTFVQQSQAQLADKALEIAQKHGVQMEQAIYILAVGCALGLRKQTQAIPYYSKALTEGFEYGMKSPL